MYSVHITSTPLLCDRSLQHELDTAVQRNVNGAWLMLIRSYIHSLCDLNHTTNTQTAKNIKITVTHFTSMFNSFIFLYLLSPWSFHFDYSISLVTKRFILFCIANYHRYFWSGIFNKEVKICYFKHDSIVVHSSIIINILLITFLSKVLFILLLAKQVYKLPVSQTYCMIKIAWVTALGADQFGVHISCSKFSFGRGVGVISCFKAN